MISELSTGTTASATQEFVELYNGSDQPVDLSGWKLQYKSATSVDEAKSWDTRASLSGQIQSGGYFLIATKDYLKPQILMTSGLAQSGGHIRLLDGSGSEVDRLGWGTANAAKGHSVSAPQAGQSLIRNADQPVTGDNAADFSITTQPTPGTVNKSSETGQPAQTPAPADNLELTELLVDPAAPNTDAKDEFIELHNASDQPVNLVGYQLRSGSGLKDHYTLPDGSLAPGEYRAFFAHQTHLALTNSGGSAQLLAPDGAEVERVDYGKAPTGQSLSKFSDAWHWTADLTPGRANVLVEAPITESVTKSTTSKPIKAPKTSTPKLPKAATSPAKSKIASTKKGTAAQPADIASAASASASKTGLWLLIAAGGVTIGYAIYEFRYDLQNYYLLARRYLSARRPSR